MQKPFSVALLLFILALLAYDILIHAHSVHAQSSDGSRQIPAPVLSEVWITEVPRVPANKTTIGKPVMVRGGSVIGFSCVGDSCFILSNK